LRALVDGILATLHVDFEVLHAKTVRPSIQPERLLRASLIQTLYSIRSERQSVQHIDYNPLYRWFVGLDMDDKVWDHSGFMKNRDRRFNETVARSIFGKVLGLA
jgi:transposase